MRKTAVSHSRDCILNRFMGFYSVFLYLRKSRSSYTPPSGIPWAFCVLAFRTSFAETKKMRFLASTGSITLSSSTRKVRQRSMCCLRTWGKGKKLMKKRQKLSLQQITTSGSETDAELPLWRQMPANPTEAAAAVSPLNRPGHNNTSFNCISVSQRSQPVTGVNPSFPIQGD